MIAYFYGLDLINDVFDDVEFVRNLVGIGEELASYLVVVWNHIIGYTRDCEVLLGRCLISRGGRLVRLVQG